MRNATRRASFSDCSGRSESPSALTLTCRRAAVTAACRGTPLSERGRLGPSMGISCGGDTSSSPLAPHAPYETDGFHGRVRWRQRKTTVRSLLPCARGRICDPSGCMMPTHTGCSSSTGGRPSPLPLPSSSGNLLRRRGGHGRAQATIRRDNATCRKARTHVAHPWLRVESFPFEGRARRGVHDCLRRDRRHRTASGSGRPCKPPRRAFANRPRPGIGRGIGRGIAPRDEAGMSGWGVRSLGSPLAQGPWGGRTRPVEKRRLGKLRE